MKIRIFLLKSGLSIALLVATLAMSSPVVSQAVALPIIVDNNTPADHCGKYDGKTADSDPVNAINNATSGQKVLICPGTYNLSGQIEIEEKKLIISRVLTGPSSRPVLTIDSDASFGIYASKSTVTIDGLILDATFVHEDYIGILLSQSSATIEDTAIIGPTSSLLPSSGMFVSANTPNVQKVSIHNSYIVGYRANGIWVEGSARLSLTSSHLDGTDGGRVMVPSGSPIGVQFVNGSVGPGPTGTVSGCRILNHAIGISVRGSSNVSITKNTFVDNETGVMINAVLNNTDNTKVIANTILGVPEDGHGVFVLAGDNLSSKKTIVSNNLIAAAQSQRPFASSPDAIRVESVAPALTTVTATISGNTLLGFPLLLHIVNVDNFAGLTIKANDALP